MRRILKIRLWLLLALFIPIAFGVRHLNEKFNPDFAYTEDESSLSDWSVEGQRLDFDSRPGGTPMRSGKNLNNAYDSLGVSFAVSSSVEPVTIRSSENESGESISDLFDEASEQEMFVGVSGYMIDLGGATKSNSICCYTYELRSGQGIHSGSSKPMARFEGRMLIKFHKPNENESKTSVRRVGFVASMLDHPSTLTVTAYTPEGTRIGSAQNKATGTVFMGLKSRRNIGYVEIIALGEDANYAITQLVFTKPK